ncbi:hypothetical protein F2P56_000982 [Juglans regia]|uniref:Uncharacterized protein LOC108988035 n=2 Tax=Juglans regia TaxID=51240 RepID=A0A2I4EBA3_JUGRE|nr:uncharacterized protein LOC108988035 [Juglans regia]KAF5480217.1 hypothetical protein F2P56_000982 [Juglans regia]
MMQKRPFVDEDSYDIASKQPRLEEHASQVAHTIDTDTVSSINAPEKPQTDGEGGAKFTKFQDEGRLVNDSATEVSNETKVLETGVSGSISNFLWVNERIIGADVRSEAAAHLSFFPEFFQPRHQLKALYHSDELYSSLFNCPPTKPVSVGPEHQAFVPEWGVQPLNNSSHLDQSDGGLFIDDINELLMGKCVIPMPDLEASTNSCYESGQTRHDCRCLDEGSVRCVRQHVMEVREKLRENLGREIFEELGFGEMGEEVAKKWTLEEERAFHEVVLSNPASLDKNFWDHLLAVFPSRTKKDLVCYYFNVFVVRKRAEQNRFDPLNVDSDNDEWLKSELEPLEEDEDSVVESPFDQAAAVYYQEDQIDFLEDIEVGEEVNDCEDGADIVTCRVGSDEEDEGYIDDISGTHVSNSVGDCRGDVDLELCGKISCSNGEDDVQDDSCTSYECQQDRVETCGPPDARIDARESSEE